ncbi:hypothetical protein [Pseudonocardia sp. ICBG1034]|uniref:hypothetical protein n=1 Tax=Pseudonocardia sp. ICBG1034 TaxID=2844381 RepID=UPI0027E17EA3|nr:hypothetical protein [Pseudonocardia sp. ICBG1034]
MTGVPAARARLDEGVGVVDEDLVGTGDDVQRRQPGQVRLEGQELGGAGVRARVVGDGVGQP